MRLFKTAGYLSTQSFTHGCAWLAGILLIAGTSGTQAGQRQIIHHSAPAAATNSVPLRHSSRWKKLDLTIGLPLRDREGLTNLLREIYTPGSPNFRHFLTPEEFAQRFGPTAADYEAVASYAKSNGLFVTARHSNRMVLSVRAMIGDIERAFHIKINEYQHPTESRTFFAPNGDPSLDLATPILSISGLDSFVLPHPCLQKSAQKQTNKPQQTGSAPGGGYMGNDFRAAYVPGVTLTGVGQTVGLLEFDSGFHQSDIAAYENLAGLPNVPVTAVLLDGYNGGPGIGNDEVSLDIEMAISLAPGLSNIFVYEGSTTDDILNRMATDNLAKQIGASWTYPIDATSEQIFLQYAAQGQSFYNASGDSDAYTGVIPTPSDDPNITVVGGTTLTTTGPGGAWSSEKVWNWGSGTGSSGGISTVYPIPVWQQGISMASNQGSTTMRNLPDVALTADNVYVAYGGGQSGIFGGTSCATPLWAALTALMNQMALTNGEPYIGFINPAVYAIGKGSNYLGYTNLFHDITTGDNESPSSPSRFSAVPGYDLCTGWGTPTGGSLISSIAVPEPLQITPAAVEIFSGPVGGPFGPATQNFVLTNTGGNPVAWNVTNTSSLFSVSPTNGTVLRGRPAAVVTVSVTGAAASLTPGSYPVTLKFTDLSDGFVGNRQLNLAVVTPPVITAQPTNEALLDGMTASFSVGIAPNALMFYQWRKNGTNLLDGGSVFGSATGTLTISNVSATNAASYSVVLSNAAGVLASSNALLTIVPSRPVIVQQPTNTSVLPGAPASFSVSVVGNTPYSYQWMFNGTNLPANPAYQGITSNVLTLFSVGPANLGAYSVVISNSLGFTNSSGATLSTIPVTEPGLALATLWSFDSTNTGANPYCPLVQATDFNLYGTTLEGSPNEDGTIFRITTNGALTTLVEFNYNNGANPYAGVIQGSDGNLYGTTFDGGTDGEGEIFRCTTAGAVSVLTSFNDLNGLFPVGGLVQGTDGNFYGTTLEGGDYGYGTIFRTGDSTQMFTLASFNYTDGAYPSPVLVQGNDGNFYGTTENGGATGAGTIFKISPSGFLTTLYSFTGGSDGAVPVAGLVQGLDGNFYGTAYEAGTNGFGTVFEISPTGAFTLRYSFTGSNDGGSPWGGLMLARDGNLYGTTQSGGLYMDGTVFQMAPTGQLNTIAQFDGYQGANASAALAQSKDGSLYGTTQNGGIYNDGAVYRLTISGPLQITGQPADQSVYDGGTAVFSVATFGAAPVSYQWQQDGVNLTNGGNISGVNTANLTISNASAANVAFYSVIVSNASSVLSSDEALLEVIYSPPNITLQPVSQALISGSTAFFNVTAVGDLPMAYQWQVNGTNLLSGRIIIGANSPSLTLSNIIASTAGSYSVMISNPIFTVRSSNAVLTVLPAATPGSSSTTLYQFPTASSGVFPYGNLIQATDGNLYGTTESGGTDIAGVIFKSTLAGSVTTLYSFTDYPGGANPYGGLLQATNGKFYGTTSAGGTNFDGTVYSMNANGSGVTVLYNFSDGNDGADPLDSLIQGVDGNFYGTATDGGANGAGAVFAVTAAGILTPLYGFSDGDDGGFPEAGVIQGRDGKLYGATVEGGSNGYGTVFSLTTNGALATLAEFDYETNGAFPIGGVIQGADGSLYGTTADGGSNSYGTVFRVTTNGVLTTLFSFSNTNGGEPEASLVQGTDWNLYGTTSTGGRGGQGTVFRISTNGAFSTLLWFNGYNGANPQAALIQASDGNFYGTTAQGGAGFNVTADGGNGIIFRVTVPIFITNPITTISAVAGVPYSATITNFALGPAGDTLSFGKVSGPSWLIVGTNGFLSGAPPLSALGTNVFIVSLTDTNGITATTTLRVNVVADPAPVFLRNPFSQPWANVDEPYSAPSIITNVTDQEITNGDTFTFARVSGPSWLNVAVNGTLSGTPLDINAGSNTFVVIATNLGGSATTATMIVYVNSPPSFEPADFTKPAAVAGLPYTGSIASNAIDPDLPAGDTLTFYFVTGPNWLSVAANGALSGTPSTGNLGVNTFLVLVVDSGGLSGVGEMSLTVNNPNPPVFLTNPFQEAGATAGAAYTATIATNASDPNPGAVMTFSKVSGPPWLNLAANGSLSGTPVTTNVGTNFFIVNVADGTGLSSYAVMSINVASAAPLVMKITPQGTNLVLSWSGGVAPYQVMMSHGLGASTWQNVGGLTTATNMVISHNSAGAFYQVHGQ